MPKGDSMKIGLRRGVAMAAMILFFAAAFSFGGGGCSGAFAAKKKSKSPPKKTESKVTHKIVVYYFHGKFRCETCKRMEAYSTEAIKNGFPDQLKSGILEWQVVNVEEKGNEHFVKDYELFTKSLVMVEMKDGKQVRWKNLEKIWDLSTDKDAFVKYVKDEVSVYVKDVEAAAKKKKKVEKKKSEKKGTK
jgi:hypothetical protein